MEAATVKLSTSIPTKLNGKSHKRQHPAARDLVIEYFRSHPGVDVHVQTLKEHVAVKRPDLGKSAIYTIVHGLKQKGLILQTRARWYRVTSNIVLPETPLTLYPDSAPPELPPSTPPTPPVQISETTRTLSAGDSQPEPSASPAASLMVQLAVRTGDSFIDGYLEELDAAISDMLKAFDRIDAIAKRTHKTLVHFAALKCSLGMLDAPEAATSLPGTPVAIASSTPTK